MVNFLGRSDRYGLRHLLPINLKAQREGMRRQLETLRQVTLALGKPQDNESQVKFGKLLAGNE